MIQSKIRIRIYLLLLFSLPFYTYSQVVLKADGPGNTYELINSVLAPGKNAVEAPDTMPLGNHAVFGRHIAEVWDAELKANVFEFYAHINYSNGDKTTTTDNEPVGNVEQKQRIEIKSYEPSPDNLKGTLGETITYQWKFRLPKGFQPSSNFTHLHQIKAVGGDQDMPIFTLSAKKGKVNQFNVVHNNVVVLASIDLSELEGVWVEITEVIKVGANGTFSIVIKRVKDGKELLSYSNANLETIRPDNTFIRPKWGIYRSLKKIEDLKAESVRFADFLIAEGSISSSPK
nr:heparin lyase I family protein [uncultured Flavobacterium sp.]